MAAFERISAAVLLAVSLCASAALPGEATVWTLKDFYPNFDSADTCALTRSAGTMTDDWYAVVDRRSRRALEPRPVHAGGAGLTRVGPRGGRVPALGGTDQVWSSGNELFYFGYIFYGAGVIDTLQMDNPESNVVLPASVSDAGSNPLWSTVYYNSGTHRYYDNSGNLLGTTTFGEYARIEIHKIDDPIDGPPLIALQIAAGSGPTASGPWTLGESIVLRQTMTNSDAANCDGSAHAHRGMYEWRLGSTLLFRSDDGWHYHP